MLSKAPAFVLFTSEKTSDRHHRDNTEGEVRKDKRRQLILGKRISMRLLCHTCE